MRPEAERAGEAVPRNLLWYDAKLVTMMNTAYARISSELTATRTQPIRRATGRVRRAVGGNSIEVSAGMSLTRLMLLRAR